MGIRAEYMGLGLQVKLGLDLGEKITLMLYNVGGVESILVILSPS